MEALSNDTINDRIASIGKKLQNFKTQSASASDGLQLAGYSGMNPLSEWAIYLPKPSSRGHIDETIILLYHIFWWTQEKWLQSLSTDLGFRVILRDIDIFYVIVSDLFWKWKF